MMQARTAILYNRGTLMKRCIHKPLIKIRPAKSAALIYAPACMKSLPKIINAILKKTG